MKKGSKMFLASVLSASVLFGGDTVNAKMAYPNTTSCTEKERKEVLSGWKYADSTNDWHYYINGIRQKYWVYHKDEWYYFGSDGRMKTGWIEDSGLRYHLSASGAMTTGWLFDDGGWYYLGDNGAMAMGWIEVDGERYYLSADGQRIAHDWVEESDGTRYYFHGNGQLAQGWLDIEEGEEEERYYFNEDGSMATGWIEDDDAHFFLDEEGTIVTGWLEDEEDNRFFLDEESGQMLTEGFATDVDGSTYTFDDDGIATKVDEVETTFSDVTIRVGSEVYSDDMIAYAKQFMGVPYVYGGETPHGFDCSAFIQYAFRESIGRTLPRTSAAMYEVGESVGRADLVAGDLVFFNTLGNGVSHVAIYIGGNEILHSQNSYGVSISSLDGGYWSDRYIGAKRVL